MPFEAEGNHYRRTTPSRKPGKKGFQRTRSRFAPSCEPLEERTLLSAGDLDPMFNLTGKVLTSFTGSAQADSIAIQSKGQLVVGGSISDGTNANFALVRYMSDGTPDWAFGTQSVVTTHIGTGNSGAVSVAIDSLDRIVVGGFASVNGTLDFMLTRYQSDGKLDTSFGFGGRTYTDFNFGDDDIRSIVIEPHGEILAAGSAATSPGGPFILALAQYDANGNINHAFGANGKVTTSLGTKNSVAQSVVVQPNGDILVGGIAIPLHAGGAVDQFALVRYYANGSRDYGFGPDGTGIALNAIGISNASAYALALQPNGNIIQGGNAYFNSHGLDFALLRLDSNGILDKTFGDQGIRATDFAGRDEAMRSLVVRPDGSILAAGASIASISSPNATYDFALASYDSNGNLDTTFGTAANTFGPSGTVTTDFGGNGEGASGLLVQPDGRIVAAGSSVLQGGTSRFVVARYQGTQTATLADVSLKSVTTPDAERILVDYTIGNAQLDNPLEFIIFKSHSQIIDMTSVQIGSSQLIPTGSDLAPGSHLYTLPARVDLTPDPDRSYIIVQANPLHVDMTRSNLESNYNNNTSYFQKHILGVVTHGLTPPFTFASQEQWMADYKAQLLADNYQDVIVFPWLLRSTLPLPGQTKAAANDLTNIVMNYVSGILINSAHPGDVVDIHFIGHSRGAVVISLVLQQLEALDPVNLRGSYLKMTMIDPHSAKNYPIPFQSFNPLAPSRFLKSLMKLYSDFQDTANDPDVVVPKNVKSAEIFFQQTNSLLFLTKNFTQGILNLWGHGRTEIINQTGRPLDSIKQIELSNIPVEGIGFIGHSEILTYYLNRVAKKRKTFTFFS